LSRAKKCPKQTIGIALQYNFCYFFEKYTGCGASHVRTRRFDQEANKNRVEIAKLNSRAPSCSLFDNTTDTNREVD
jgi:hypothetical protein